MEDTKFKKDETPYYVFSCKKCHHYSYVKTIQKTKKCLRCGKMHQVKDIEIVAEVVLGMTRALHRVRELQDQLAREELRSTPDFRSDGQFMFPTKEREHDDFLPILDEESYESQFYVMLRDISRTYQSFPRYILEIMMENYEIPESSLPTLIRKFVKKGVLIKNNGDFKVKNS